MRYNLYRLYGLLVINCLLPIGFIKACGLPVSQRFDCVEGYTIAHALGKKDLISLAIIGSGPAGLSAALYGARSGLYTVVFEGRNPGGLLTETTYVENWPGIPKALGPVIIDNLKKQVLSFGAITVDDTVVKADFSQWPFVLELESGKRVYALTVIGATGARPCFLNDTRNVAGEWDYIGRGISSCAVCDAPFYKDADVVVVGGGDSAAEEALYLTSYARSILMLVRGPSLRASSIMQARLKEAPSIRILYNTQVQEFLGTEEALTGVRIRDTKEGAEKIVTVAGAFIAIGHSPNVSIFKEWGITDKEGFIKVGPYSQQTAIPGLFAAGDVTDRVYRQAGVAAGDGIKAALDAYSFLQSCGYNQSFAQSLEKGYYRPYKNEGS